jgi:cobaltochelatase CobT
MADESPLDRFKLALTGAARAIAREPEAEVAWSQDAPTIQGKAMRVPMPGRNLPPQAAREARGFADSFALRLRHHNEKLHARGMPAEPAARAAYDAIERVRYEALGENAYSGMRANLAASTDLRTRSDPISRAAGEEEVPLPAALALMLREKLTGQPLPPSAEANVELVRESIAARAGDDFERLAALLDDQNAFQRLGLDMLRHLERYATDDLDERGDEDMEGDEEDGGEDKDEGDEESGDEQRPQEMTAEEGEGEDDGESEGEAPQDQDMSEGDVGDEGEEAMLPVRPTRPWTELPETFDY